MDHDEPGAADIEVLREAITMALYISLSLLAVILALPPSLTRDATTPALTVGLTALGLVVAHQFAFRLSTRLVSKGELDTLALRLLGAQIAGGLAVAAAAVLPVLILGPDGLTVSVILLMAFVAVAGYLAGRAASMSRIRSLAYVAAVVLVAGGILFIKGLGSH